MKPPHKGFMSKNRWLFTLILIKQFLFTGITQVAYAQSNANLEGVVPKQKQAIAIDYQAEGAGANHTLGFFFFDIDTDKDGIPDFFEVAASEDLDGDGLSNGVDPDDDNDGIPDVADVQPAGIFSMPGSFFRDGTKAEIAGATAGDYWQFVPNNLIVGGKYNGMFEHPGAYLYVDNNQDSIPDVLQYSTNDLPPYVIDTGFSANHVLLGAFPTLLGDWEYSGTPGVSSAFKKHTLGKTIFELADDDSGNGVNPNYSNYSPYFPETSDIYGTADGQVDYDIYGTSDPNSPKIPTEVFGTDPQGVDYFRYRWFENQINKDREIVFFVITYWNSSGSSTNTYYSKPELNQLPPWTTTNRNGRTSGDDFGGWVGQNDWYPNFQSTSEHDALAAGVFGAGTTWSMIASSPTDGSSPVALLPANQPWVDLYENWREDRKILQYLALGDMFDFAAGANARFLGRYGIDLSADNQNIIIRAQNSKTASFLISPVEGDTNSYFIGVEDIIGDRDYDDVMFYFTYFAGVNISANLESFFQVGQCFDTITYQATIRNSGTADATGVVFDLTPDANSALVVGTVKTTSGAVIIGNTVGDVTVQVNAGTIAPGDSVLITFQVGFNSAIYPGTNTLSTQGTVSGGNFANVLTTDRNGVAVFQPTVTDLDSFFIMPIRGPSDTTVALGNSCDFTLPDFRDSVFVDNFCPPLTKVQNPAPGSSISANSPVNIGVTDNNGRSASWVFNITVEDTTAPNVIVKNPTIYLDSTGFVLITPDSIDNGSNDNCGPFTRTISEDTLDCADIGANTVWLVLTDTAGNADSATSTITISDTISPVVIPGSGNVYIGAGGNIVVTPAMVDSASYDNCGIASMNVAPNFFTCGNIGPNSITLTVTDVNGNSKSKTFTINVVDSIKPTVSTNNVTAYLSPVGIANVTPVDIDNGSSDNCGILALSLSQSFFNCGDTGTNTVFLTITDINGNVDSASAIVTIVDTVSPNVSTTNVSVPLGTGGTIVVPPSVVNNFSFDNCGIDSMNLTPNTFNCSNVGPNNVVLTVYDVNGNSKSGTAIITIQDTTSPNVVTQDITVYLDPAGNATITPAMIDNGTSDPCGIASLSLDITGFTCADLGANTVLLTATDNNTNSRTRPATVTVLDTVSPIAAAQNRTVHLDPAGLATLPPSLVNNGSSDACGIDSLALIPDTFFCSDVGPNAVVLQAFDASGNVDSDNATITVIDTVDPMVVTQNITVYLDGTGMDTVLPGAVDNGSADACGIASLALAPNSFGCAQLGANNVTLTVTDNNGNSKNGTAIVTVLDTTGATVLTQDITVYLNPAGNVSITASDVNNGTNDACGISGLSLSQTAFDCSHLGPNTVTLTATDNNSNVSSGTAVVTVLDTVSPTAIGQNQTIYLDPTGVAIMDPTLVNNGSSDACGIDSFFLSTDTFFCPDVGPNSVDFFARDSSGNSSASSVTITVVDSVDPNVITQNINVYLDGTGNATITAAQIDNGSSDACGIASLSVWPNAFNCSNLGPNNVTLTVNDNNGNSKTGSAIVTILDTVGPTVATQNITVYLSAFGTVSIAASDVDNGSGDACGGVTLAVAPNTFNCTNVGPNNVTLTVTDGAGNSRNGTAVVTVLDTVSPNAIAQNLTVYLNPAGNVNITAAMVDNGSNDACGIGSLALSQTSFGCGNLGANNVTLTVTDNNGNNSDIGAVITVVDTVSPTVVTQNSNVYLDSLGNVTVLPSQVDNGSSDACGILSMSVWPNSFNCSDVGPQNVTLTVNDFNGNSNSGPATINILDTFPPTVITQPVNVPLDANGIAVINASSINNGSWDACGIASITSDPDTFTCTETGPQIVTLFVTDIHGNTGTATETVIIIETVPPIAVAQNINAYLDANGVVGISGMDIDGGSSDNCALGPMMARPDTFFCADIGPNNTWLVVSDLFGSRDSAISVVTVIDTISPTVITKVDTVYLDNAGIGTLLPNDVDDGSFDACGINSRSVSPNTFSCADTGINVVDLTVWDANGNSRTSSTNVLVLDTINPNAVTQPIDVYTDITGSAAIDPWALDNGSWDACGIDTIIVTPSVVNCATLGPVNVTVVVLDVNGNSTLTTETVTVIDTVSPLIFSQNITAYLDASGKVTVPGILLDNGSVDACNIASYDVIPDTFNCSNIGVNNVQFVVTDLSGNSSTGPAQITIFDTISPQVITQNIDLYLDPNGLGVITPASIDNVSIEACGINSSTIDIDSFFCSDIGANTVTLSIEDVNGNSSSNTAIVTVIDTVSPDVQVQNLTIYLDNSGMASILPSQVDNGSSDACGISTYVLSQQNFDCSNTGLNQVTLTVTDVNGNSANRQADITVLDTIDPNPIAQNLTIYLDASGSATISSSMVDNGSSDNCGFQLNLSDSLFDCADTGANNISLIVTDPSGNSASAPAIITVLDTLSPVLSLQDITIFLDQNGTASISQGDIDVGSSDNCSLDPLMLSQSVFSCADTGTIVIQVTGNDPSGNTSTENVNILVRDTISPTITCPSDQTLNNDLDSCGGSVSLAIPNTGDNCAVLSFSNDFNGGQDASGYYPVGVTNVIYTILDVNGNQNTCSFSVTVVDDQVPSIADAGNDDAVCRPEVDLSAQTPSSGIGFWTLVSGSGQIQDQLSPSTRVTQLGLGTNLFAWTVTGPCQSSSDTVAVNYTLLSVEAGNDTTVLDGELIQLNARTNVGDDGQYSWSPTLGIDDPDRPDPILTAIQTTTYTVTYTDQTGCANFDSIVVTVSEVATVEPIKGISPNQDGNNDYWRIRGINDYPDNKVSVFNRWGNVVFETTGYDNINTVFDGKANKSGSWGSGELPDGTYYYTIDLGDGSPPLSGYLVLKR